MPSGEPIFTFKLSHSTDGKARKIWGVASAEVLDREKEIVTQGAIQKALEDFMALPIIHWYHSERPVGWITKAKAGEVTLEDGRRVPGLEVYGEIKQTQDADDIWNGIVKGTISEWSIYASRRSGSPECSIPAHQRTSPCITQAMWLWSISICPTGTAQNRTTFLEVVKAMTSGSSALVHPTVDGTKRSIRKTMAEPPIVDDSPTPGPQEQDQNQKRDLPGILEEMATSLQALSDHLGVSDSSSEEEKESPQEDEKEDQDGIKGPTANPEEVKKSAKKCPLEKGEEDCMTDEKKEISKAEEKTPQDSDVNSIVKAQAGRIEQLEAELKALQGPSQDDIVKAQEQKIAELTKEIDIIKAKTPQAKTVVMDPKLVKADRDGLLETKAPGRMAKLNNILLR